MERLVHILFWHGDIVLESPGNRLIHLMNYSQSRITVLDRIHFDPHRKQIVNLIQSLILIHHFLINAEKMLHPPVDLRLDAAPLNMTADFIDGLFDVSFPAYLLGVQGMFQFLVDIRLQISQRQIVQFHLDLGNTKPVGDRRIDVHSLSGLFLLLFRLHKLHGAHVVQTVCQFDQYDPDVLGHGKEHLP